MTGVACLGLYGLAGMAGVGPAAADVSPVALGPAWQPPENAPSGNFAPLGGNSTTATQQAEASAVSLAKKTGMAQVVSAATTQTSLVTAEPNGTLVADQNVLPVRVRSGKSWTPVSTKLARTSSGRLAAVALPGDSVSFSPGGTGPMAVLASGGSSLSLWWPGSLPVPVVSGSSATFANVMPGVSLVLTVTSAQAGGFSTNLVISSAKAARDAGLAKLALRVSTAGAGALHSVAGGGLSAQLKGGRGWFTAPAPQMWDSSVLLPGASNAAVQAAARSASAVGATLGSAGLGPKSTTAGPAAGAMVAPVKATVSGSELSLVPDSRMLTSPAVKWPLEIDPSFTSTNSTGDKQAYDAVLSDSGTGTCGPYGVCDDTNCRGSNYDSSSYSGGMPVGYDDFEDGPCQFDDTDYALYQVAAPSGAWGSQAVLIDASFKTDVVYSSSCAAATVTASWVYGIGSGTGWPGPGLMPDNSNVTASAGYNSGSCDSVQDTADTSAVGFDVTTDAKHMSSAPGNITMRVWENGDTSDANHKQFASNPTLQVTWTDKPDVPSNLGESAVSGTDSLDCDTTTSNPPRIGKTDATSGGMNLTAKYGDPDDAAVQANVRYQVGTSGSWVTESDVNESVNNATASWKLPYTVTESLADGTLIGWEAQAETGSGSVDGSTWGPYSSSWSPECYFAVYPDAPDAPKLTAGFTQTTAQAVGSSVRFTITQTGSDTDSKFVWGLDEEAPTSGTIPADQTCTASSTTCKLTVTSGVASATLSVTVPTPGPHDLNVYAVDASGNESGATDGSPGSGQTWTFSGASDTPPAPFASGATMQANFESALTQKASYDNVMISTESGSPGNANADGDGNSFDEAELKSAGWNPGGPVTIDGATFTLPQFGTASDTSDNLLADGETIGTGSSGVHGSALVFLATSTNGFAAVPGSVGTGSPDAGFLASDPTAPYTPSGYGVTGAGCSSALSTDSTAGCSPATGTITYANSCTAPTAPTSYTLAVPDWVSGPLDIAAVYTASRDHSSGQQAETPAIYAFAVPLDPSCEVTSVQLPDVSDGVTASVGNGVGESEPALHILGMAVRDTAMTTPAPGTSPDGSGSATGANASPVAPSGTAWTGAWESPIEDAFAPPSGDAWGEQTMRIAFAPNAVVPGGTTVRIRLSNPGFMARDGDAPLTIGAATIGSQAGAGSPALAAPPQVLTFGGSDSVVIPAGGDVYSDPIALSSAIDGRGVVSLELTNAPASGSAASTVPVLPMNSFPAGAQTWFSAPSTTAADENETGDTTGGSFTAAGAFEVDAVPLLSGFDVATPGGTYFDTDTGASTAYPGEPTIVVAGNNVIDGTHASAASDSGNTPSSWLAGQMYAQGQTGTLFPASGTAPAGYGITDAGLQSNMVLKDGDTAGGVPGGVSLLARVDRDILAEPDVGTVVIDEGLEDILGADGASATASSLTNAYHALQQQLQAFGVNETVVGSLTPCGGFADSTDSQACDTATETARTTVNDSMQNGVYACAVDFSGALASSTATSPVDLATAYDIGDHVNLTAGGYAALATAVGAQVTLGVCSLAPPAAPATP
ncbi:MAG TPA: hypothetical protein VG142_00960 [Trebonia sp.]|nr:hypothetical protein [Trebonia sp.]